mgnify:CR=1 FL=1|jgi:hypothetical protein
MADDVCYNIAGSDRAAWGDGGAHALNDSR